MPANLTPQYFEAERKYREATTPDEKLEALKLMLAEIPKHKGTEKLQADIKRKIAKTRSEIQKAAKHGPKGHTVHVKKEGAGQVAMVGAPNTGKSSLVNALTHACPEIADFPYTTRMPCPGMMTFENIQIQLVDLPPVSAEFMEYWVPNIIRNADLVVVLVDLTYPDPSEQFFQTKEILRQKKISLVQQIPEEPESISIAYKRMLLFANKYDQVRDPELLTLLRELIGDEYTIWPCSAKDTSLLERFKQLIYRELDIVRVYSKPPGKPADLNEPFVLPKGSTLFDLAVAVHREFAERLQYARVWGEGKFDGQRVTRDYVLMDGDIIELHV